MLQQTRVETVIPYYHRWLERFPHLDALADAPLDDVLKHWEGLGYYSRARNLRRTAQMVREQHAGVVPARYHELCSLPGIGDYTAAALASIAFGEPHAAVDGNVRRVLARVFDLAAPQPSQLQQHAAQLLDRDQPGDFNQAMMELGATVCTPRTPNCAVCPVKAMCAARRNNTVALRPAPKLKGILPQEQINTLVAVHAGQTLVVQRPDRGLLAGLWEFPAVSQVHGYTRLGTIAHAFTHKRTIYHVYASTERVSVTGQWFPLPQLSELAFSSAQRRIAKQAWPFFGL